MFDFCWNLLGGCSGEDKPKTSKSTVINLVSVAQRAAKLNFAEQEQVLEAEFRSALFP